MSHNITRIDFILMDSRFPTWRVSKYISGWDSGITLPSGKKYTSNIHDDFDIQSALNWCARHGFIVRAWIDKTNPSAYGYQAILAGTYQPPDFCGSPLVEILQPASQPEQLAFRL